ncbi:hypothetical protein SLEP1_g30923 [Rubroshorea leprosula]|uniref:Translation initiation factor 3 N-terminal domain-containing protein n=1 Tax=Rubroshorea leprosula TaxID=152421 RepID=A0AAV5KAY7_9ROSI|nr:hypothetical protein SLEP1_g30923 [Rubroshorea leprosula]
MVFWHRISQSKLKLIPQQFKRYYFQISHVSPLNDRGVSVLGKPYWYIHKKPTDFCNNVRFFAAPVQVKPKKEEAGKDGPRLNEQITAQFVRLVSEDGHTVVSRQEALQRAKQLKLDLVEVQSSAKPPVCKIMDFHHEIYKRHLVEKDRAKAKAGVSMKKGAGKEVRFTPKIEQKDLEMKANTIKRLMESGYRVKCMAVGKGKEGEDENLGELLSRLTHLIEDVALVESGPFIEKRQAYVVVRHVKFGPPKKGAAKKLTAVGDISKPAAINPQSNVLSEDNSQQSVSPSEDENEIPSDADDVCIQMHDENVTAWSVKDSDHDFENVFDFKAPKERAMANSMNEETRAALQTVNLPQTGDASNFVRTKPAVEFTRANKFQHSHAGSLPDTENRYKRSEPRGQFSSPSANIFQPSHPGSSPETENRYNRSEPRSQFPPLRANTIQPFPPGSSPDTENRYKRSEPRSQFSPPRSMDYQVQAKREPFRPEPQFPYQRRQPPHETNNASSSVGQTKQVADNESALRNSKPSQKTSSYGIFSTPKTNPPGTEGIPAGEHQNRGPGGSQNFPGSKPDDSQSGGKSDKGGFGIFSRPSMTTTPSRISKPN